MPPPTTRTAPIGGAAAASVAGREIVAELSDKSAPKGWGPPRKRQTSSRRRSPDLIIRRRRRNRECRRSWPDWRNFVGYVDGPNDWSGAHILSVAPGFRPSPCR